MFAPNQYQLLDFGDGRRLERFGDWILDRPCPTAENDDMADPQAWRQAHARFIRNENDKGCWELTTEQDLPQQWP
ncbi:MAG: hypothetical protein JXM70_21715, partial [Pirellulales bacterium]|nr:hypothetical protein [Pirellulales bacterium]